MYLEANPQTITVLAYFDLELYEPTLATLRATSPYLTCGSVIAFDQHNHAKWPGETAAPRCLGAGGRAAPAPARPRDTHVSH